MRPTSIPPAIFRPQGARGAPGSTLRPTAVVAAAAVPARRSSRRSLALVVAAALLLALWPPRAWAQDASPIATPIVVTDDEGAEVILAEAPERIVSLTPGTTEILFAIG